MSVTELNAYIKRTGLLLTAGIKVPVVVLDAKRAYGNLRFRVTPDNARNTQLNGMRQPLKLKLPADAGDFGAIWVAAERVELD